MRPFFSSLPLDFDKTTIACKRPHPTRCLLLNNAVHKTWLVRACPTQEWKKNDTLSNLNAIPMLFPFPYLQPEKKELSVSHTRLKYRKGRSVGPILGSTAVMWWTPWSGLLAWVWIRVLTLIGTVRVIAGFVYRRTRPPLPHWWRP